ncbi:MAG: alpha/beta fold hydrolase, partial [Stackebrandtia sp.]
HRRVAAPDLPGHGSRAHQRFTMDSAVDTVDEAIDSVGGRALLVGLSLGGYVAIATAARHPTKLPGMVAMSCTARITPVRTVPYRMMGWMSGTYGDAMQRWIFRRTLGAQAATTIGAGGLYGRAVPDVIDALRRFDAVAALAGYDGPSWLINGSRDHFRVDETRFLAACRHGHLDHVPRAGHLLSLTHPVSVSERIESVIAEVEAISA